MKNDFKSGFVTLIGRPNVGKSTLMNYLIGQKIAITSNKPQTTRNRIQTVLTTDEGQIVFVDTPGIHKAKNKLGEYMMSAVKDALDGVDAPVRPDVELTAEQAANFTYGEDMIANLKLPDWNVIAANQANWIASWNAIFSVK